MATTAQIKAAARRLPATDRADLLEAFVRDEAVRNESRARLRALIAEGERDHAEGRVTEVRDAADLRSLFDEIKRRGRARLKHSA